MSQTFACVAGEEIYRQIESGKLPAQPLGRRQTPFGLSGEVFRCERQVGGMLLLARNGNGLAKAAPFRINDRANIYALKDLGVQKILAWGPCGAITHNITVGDLVIVGDLLDRTVLRARTFFPDSPLGYLRQFPMACQRMSQAIASAIDAQGLRYHRGAVAAVCEGPRMETPAEIDVLAGAGAQIVTHVLAPELFLARELTMCYTAICYVVNYAETGSRHRPFMGGGLFADTPGISSSQRLLSAAHAIGPISRRVADELADADDCECHHAMDPNITRYGLSSDWRTWLSTDQG